MTTPMNITTPSTPSSAAPAVSLLQPSDNQSTESLLLHPLVVLNISDHFNRFAAMRLFPAQASAPNLENPPPQTLTDLAGTVRVIGLLLGTQINRTVDICHSLELPARADPTTGATTIAADFVQTRIEQYKQIFPKYDVVGWYTTGPALSDDDLRLHTDLFSTLNESPILLLMDVNACMSSFAGRLGAPAPAPLPSPAAPSVPSAAPDVAALQQPRGSITLYQAELHVVATGPRTVLAPVQHRFASADSERIAVDHVSAHAVRGGSEAQATQHLSTLRRSVEMLGERVDVLLKFLASTQTGEVPVDFEMLRKIKAVAARLPQVEEEPLVEAFGVEKTDTVTVAYMCGLTKSACAMNELVECFVKAGYQKNSAVGPRRRM